MIAGEWPDAALEDHPPARIIQQVSRNLRDVMTGLELSANALAKASEVNRQCIANVLAGRVWPDMLTVASLETTLEVILWPFPQPGMAPHQPLTPVTAAGARHQRNCA